MGGVGKIVWSDLQTGSGANYFPWLLFDARHRETHFRVWMGPHVTTNDQATHTLQMGLVYAGTYVSCDLRDHISSCINNGSRSVCTIGVGMGVSSHCETNF